MPRRSDASFGLDFTVADILEKITKTRTEPTVCSFARLGGGGGRRAVLQTSMQPHIAPDKDAQGSIPARYHEFEKTKYFFVKLLCIFVSLLWDVRGAMGGLKNRGA